MGKRIDKNKAKDFIYVANTLYSIIKNEDTSVFEDLFDRLKEPLDFDDYDRKELLNSIEMMHDLSEQLSDVIKRV